MLLRLFNFALVQFFGICVAWFFSSTWVAVILGAWAGCVLWFCIDTWRAHKVLRWLRSGLLMSAPDVYGLWGNALSSCRRLMRQVRNQIDDSQDRLQEVLDALQATPNGVVLLDGGGHIEWCNDLASHQFGIDIQRDKKQSIGNLLRDPEFTSYYSAKNFAKDVVIVGRSSTPSRPVRISIHLHPYGDGRQLLLSRDVTAIEQAEAMRRDFIANVSHEIRTPLTVLSGFVETLQTLSLSDEEQSRYLALMAQQAIRMQSVVQDLLTLSRLEDSPVPSLTTWISIEDLFDTCRDDAVALSGVLTRKAAQSHTIDFPDPRDNPMGELAGAHTELQSAFSNLISNAIRYTPPSGKVIVQWCVGNEYVQFSVQDTGLGIAAEHIPRLTERFYRVDRSRSRETGGTGLGLAIVKHVSQRHGGFLSIESEINKGSKFTISFPKARWRLNGNLSLAADLRIPN